MNEIPVRNDVPAYTMQIDLNGETFTLFFSFNQRSEIWSMDIQDANGNEIINGILIFSGIPLLRQYYYIANLPKGDFICVDSKGTTDKPSYEEFGTRFRLLFIDEAL